MKLVTTVHGWTRETARTKLYYHVDNWCLPRYDEVIAVSPLLMQHCTDRGVAPSKLTYLPNGIDETDYQREGTGAAWRRELGVSEDALVIGCVGRFSPEKGVDRAIRTLAELRRVYPKVELHLIGDGAEYEKLQALACELKVADAVRFLGWQSNAKRFYEMMDVLLLPSHTEGLPNVVLEAMAMGVPVAATEVGGVRALLDKGRCGVLLNQDQASWAGYIAPLIVSPARRIEVARLARQRIERHYSFANRMAGEVEVYERVLSIGSATQRRRAA